MPWASFRYPGIENVEHAYFYAVGAVDDSTRQDYLCSGRARLGRGVQGPSTGYQSRRRR